MLSILIGHSYFLRFDRKQLERAKPYPPLATLQTAALLRQAQHRVALFDAMLAEDTSEYERQLAAVRPQLVLLYEDNFNYLSKMCLGRMRQAACRMIAAARRAGARVIAAGSDASDAPQAYYAAGAHLVLIGEGLPTLLAVIARLDANPHLPTAQLAEGLPDIASATEGRQSAPAGANLLPTPQQPELPAWDLLDMDSYRRVWRAAHGFFSLNMAASRGCPFRCNWCAKPIWGNQYLQRPAAAVAAEMTYLKRTFAADHVWFTDDIFGFRPDWVLEFAASARAAGGMIPFTIQTRADLTTIRMADVLREAGCREAWIGAESGSQRILDAMNKGTRVDEIITARQRFKERGIRVGFFIQVGYLGEELEDIIATRELISAARPDDIGVSVSYPLPGTKFYEQVKAQLGAQTHWQDSDDLSMMFQGTYTSEFYRAVRDLLHAQVHTDNAPPTEDDRRETRVDLQHRWSSLLEKERWYRMRRDATAAAV